METRLSRYLLLILLMLIIGLVVEENGNDGIRMTTKDKVIEHFLANRYKAGVICRDKGWQFCQNWAELPRSRFNLGVSPDSALSLNKESNQGVTAYNHNLELTASQNGAEQHEYQFNDPDSALFTHIPGCATSTLTEA
ncbi:hypothetical protein [Shewanella sp.]|uniref:hypothetical protein n=1 Tax=Shewanella sp. TaxID=50422 RepID=UPI00258FC4AA|nr:hypothetical protein [Shewanella sp.]MCJ8305306.1 hypothetical protein [Shewanella sp.]